MIFFSKIKLIWARIGLFLVLALLVSSLTWALLTRPSLERDWITEHARLPEAVFAGDQVLIRGVRDFRSHQEAPADTAYFDRTYDLSQVESLWFVLSVFHQDDWRGPAHSMLSFGFADGKFLVVSVEARKEVGESYSAWKGLFRKYELIYVVGTEEDLVLTRAVYRPDDVYIYPVEATPDKIRDLLVSMLQKANQLRLRPEFYNTLTTNCTSCLRDHANTIAPGRIPASWKVLLPGYSDELMQDLGLLAGGLTVEEARSRFWVNERAELYQGEPDFSGWLRHTGVGDLDAD